MADVTMKLLKCPTLQRLVVLVLLSLAGLGYPPDFCEAIKCYNCTGDNCAGDEITCEDGYTACSVGNGGIVSGKGCSDPNFRLGNKLSCVQEKGGGSGSCLKGDQAKLTKATCDCGALRGPQCDTPKPSTGHVEACTCTTDLCNTDQFLSGGGGGNGGSGAGLGLLAGRNLAATSGIMITVSLLTKAFFY